MKRLNILTLIVLITTAVKAGETRQAPPLPPRNVVEVKPWVASNSLSSKLPKKDKQKLEALLASAEGLLEAEGNAAQEHRDRFNATWKALSDQIGRSNWNVSITGRLAGIEWRDRLLGLRTSLQYILGSVNTKNAYNQQALRGVVDAIAELISKINGKLAIK
jgi:hypothetical protein